MPREATRAEQAGAKIAHRKRSRVGSRRKPRVTGSKKGILGAIKTTLGVLTGVLATAATVKKLDEEFNKGKLSDYASGKAEELRAKVDVPWLAKPGKEDELPEAPYDEPPELGETLIGEALEDVYAGVEQDVAEAAAIAQLRKRPLPAQPPPSAPPKAKAIKGAGVGAQDLATMMRKEGRRKFGIAAHREGQVDEPQGDVFRTGEMESAPLPPEVDVPGGRGQKAPRDEEWYIDANKGFSKKRKIERTIRGTSAIAPAVPKSAGFGFQSAPTGKRTSFASGAKLGREPSRKKLRK